MNQQAFSEILNFTEREKPAYTTNFCTPLILHLSQALAYAEEDCPPPTTLLHHWWKGESTFAMTRI